MPKLSAGADQWWDVSVSPLLGANNRVEHVVTVARDISERRANEQRLAQLVDEQERNSTRTTY
ncbi:PAS domain-containing protein [Caballeronia sp. GAWG1-1]|uniref:PAS domain-containing protein n=1 Tax=Caballeronia sp. GAWG1-1 TaxID=2921742 RepID=UPI0032ED3EE6